MEFDGPPPPKRIGIYVDADAEHTLDRNAETDVVVLGARIYEVSDEAVTLLGSIDWQQDQSGVSVFDSGVLTPGILSIADLSTEFLFKSLIEATATAEFNESGHARRALRAPTRDPSRPFACRTPSRACAGAPRRGRSVADGLRRSPGHGG